eukprot:scaffold189674_cov37-Tisochrysis_lutea.AAC.2
MACYNATIADLCHGSYLYNGPDAPPFAGDYSTQYPGSPYYGTSPNGAFRQCQYVWNAPSFETDPTSPNYISANYNVYASALAWLAPFHDCARVSNASAPQPLCKRSSHPPPFPSYPLIA